MTNEIKFCNYVDELFITIRKKLNRVLLTVEIQNETVIKIVPLNLQANHSEY